MRDCSVVAWISCDWQLARPSLEWLLRWSAGSAASVSLCFDGPAAGVREVARAWLAGYHVPGVRTEFSARSIGFANTVNARMRESGHSWCLVVVPPVVGELAPLATLLSDPAIRHAGMVAFTGKGFIHSPLSIPDGHDARSVARALALFSGSDPHPARTAVIPDPFVLLVSRSAFAAAGPFDCMISTPGFCAADLALRFARASIAMRRSRRGYFVRPPGNIGDAAVLERDRMLLASRWKDFAELRNATFSSAKVLQSAVQEVAPPPLPGGAERSQHAAGRVVAVLPTLTPYGGVLSVLNLLNHLFELGWEVCLLSLSKPQKAPILTYYQAQSVSDWTTLPEFPGGNADLVIATSWETVLPALEVQRRAPGSRIVQFVQDLEERFYKKGSAGFRGASATYPMISRKIVKTGYLQHELKARGCDARRIPPGMDLDAFFPRGGRDPRNPRVLAMCRVGHHHRGPDLIADCMKRVLKAFPTIEIGLFGSDRIAEFIPFRHRNFGLVTPDQLPAIYSGHDIFVELSRQHGFGRTGVEAMACGCATVLSDSGGVREYALPGENAMLVPVGDSRSAAAAVIALLASAAERSRIADAGLRTVRGFSDRAAAIAFVNAAMD